MKAQGNALGRRPPPTIAALKGQNNASIPDVSLIVFNVVAFEEQTELFLKSHQPMMFDLFVDVAPCLANVGLA